MVKKIVIFTASTGAGHNACAYALKEMLEKNYQVIIKDPYTLKSNESAKRVSNVYYNVVRMMPKTFGFVYNLGKVYDKLHLPSPIYQISKKHLTRLSNYLKEEDPDCVICTQLFAMEMMTYVIKKGLYIKPCYAQLTDYTMYPFMRDIEMSGYFISHKDMRKEVDDASIDAHKVYFTGIPTSAKYLEKLTKEEALQRLNLNLDLNKKVILITSGSVGGKNILSLTKKISNLYQDAYIFVLTGNNTKQYEKLKNLNLLNVTPVPFTKEFKSYLSICDVVLSKPGGLSTTEIINYNVPLIHISSIPGIETDNALFFESHGCSFNAKKDKDAIKYLDILLNNQEAKDEMLKKQTEIFKNNDITLIERLVEKAND